MVSRKAPRACDLILKLPSKGVCTGLPSVDHTSQPKSHEYHDEAREYAPWTVFHPTSEDREPPRSLRYARVLIGLRATGLQLAKAISYSRTGTKAKSHVTYALSFGDQPSPPDQVALTLIARDCIMPGLTRTIGSILDAQET